MSTLVSGANYQQVFKMAEVLPSYTMQFGLPKFDPAAGTWTVKPFTMLGAMVKSWDLSQSNGGILELKLDVDAREVKTATALPIKMKYIYLCIPISMGVLMLHALVMALGEVETMKEVKG